MNIDNAFNRVVSGSRFGKGAGFQTTIGESNSKELYLEMTISFNIFFLGEYFHANTSKLQNLKKHLMEKLVHTFTQTKIEYTL